MAKINYDLLEVKYGLTPVMRNLLQKNLGTDAKVLLSGDEWVSALDLVCRRKVKGSDISLMNGALWLLNHASVKAEVISPVAGTDANDTVGMTIHRLIEAKVSTQGLFSITGVLAHLNDERILFLLTGAMWEAGYSSISHFERDLENLGPQVIMDKMLERNVYSLGDQSDLSRTLFELYRRRTGRRYGPPPTFIPPL